MDNLWIIYGYSMDNLWIIYGYHQFHLMIHTRLGTNLAVEAKKTVGSCVTCTGAKGAKGKGPL